MDKAIAKMHAARIFIRLRVSGLPGILKMPTPKSTATSPIGIKHTGKIAAPSIPSASIFPPNSGAQSIEIADHWPIKNDNLF
jgi:hypothetical protein